MLRELLVPWENQLHSCHYFERRLELAMEGQRFFDLARYDHGTGSMAATLNAYVAVEKNRSGFYLVIIQLYLPRE